MIRKRTDDLRPGDVLLLGVAGPETVISVRHAPGKFICHVTVRRRRDGVSYTFPVAAEATHTVEAAG